MLRKGNYAERVGAGMRGGGEHGREEDAIGLRGNRLCQFRRIMRGGKPQPRTQSIWPPIVPVGAPVLVSRKNYRMAQRARQAGAR